MQLQELFDKTHEYSVVDDGNESGMFTAQFDSGGRMIEFTAINQILDGKEEWDISFVELRVKGRTFTSSHEVTGSGDELAVFGTVLKILNDFIKKHNPQLITFTSSKTDRNRTNLYRRMVKRLEKDGWKHKVDTDSSDYRDYFTLTKENKWQDNLDFAPNLWGHKELEKALDAALNQIGSEVDGMKRSTIWIRIPDGARTNVVRKKLYDTIAGPKFARVLAKFNLVLADFEDFDSNWSDKNANDFKILVRRKNTKRPIKAVAE